VTDPSRVESDFSTGLFPFLLSMLSASPIFFPLYNEILRQVKPLLLVCILLFLLDFFLFSPPNAGGGLFGFSSFCYGFVLPFSWYLLFFRKPLRRQSFSLSRGGVPILYVLPIRCSGPSFSRGR